MLQYFSAGILANVLFFVFVFYFLQQSDEKLPQKKVVEKDSKFKAAKKALKRNFIVNTKVKFTEDGEVSHGIFL